MFNDPRDTSGSGDRAPRMTRQARPWKLAGSAVVAADGTATVQLIMPASGDYYIETTSVALSVAAAGAVAKVYRDAVSQLNFVEGSSNGSGDSSNTRHHLTAGDTILAVWEGATPGTVASFRISGLFTPVVGL